MEHRFDRLDDKLDTIRQDIVDIKVQHERRITRIETRQKGFFTILSAIWIASSAWVMHKLGLRV